MAKFRCPNCGVGLEADGEVAGQAFTCPRCGQEATIRARMAWPTPPRRLARGADTAVTRLPSDSPPATRSQSTDALVKYKVVNEKKP